MFANGTYTIRNTETGEYRTLMVSTQRAGAKFAPGKRVLALLTGRDNERDYQSFAFVEDDKLTVWRGKRGETGVTAWDIIGDMVRVLCMGIPSQFGKAYPGYDVLCEKTCRRCNRKLTTPESIEAGIGPECQKMAA